MIRTEKFTVMHWNIFVSRAFVLFARIFTWSTSIHEHEPEIYFSLNTVYQVLVTHFNVTVKEAQPGNLRSFTQSCTLSNPTGHGCHEPRWPFPPP